MWKERWEETYGEEHEGVKTWEGRWGDNRRREKIDGEEMGSMEGAGGATELQMRYLGHGQGEVGRARQIKSIGWGSANYGPEPKSAHHLLYQ